MSAEEHAVIIPESDISQLQLRSDIVQAVHDGKFAVWAVSHVSQGVELLTGEAWSEAKRKADAANKQRMQAAMAFMQGGR